MLKSAEFLYETSLFPDLEFTFKHALTHEVAYGTLLHEPRRALHARVVAALEDLHGDRLPEQFASLTHHAYLGEQWEKTVRYARLAGDEAAARSAHRQVVELCRQAISALAHMADAIPANLHRALALADALDDIRWRSRITSALAHYHWVRRELSPALPLAHRGVDLAERTGDVSEITFARGTLGRVHWARGEYGAAVTVFQQCLEIESSEAPRAMSALVVPSVVSQRWLAQSLAELGAFEAAIAAGREALHTAETRNHPYSLANALQGLGMVMLRRGGFAEAAQLFERAGDVAREFGFREFMVSVQPLLATAYAEAGRQTDAQAILNASRESLRSALHCQARVGEAALAVGALPLARQHAEAALEFSRKQTARGDETWSLYLLGAVTAGEESGAVAASEYYYRQGLTLAEELGMRPLIAHCHRGLGELYRRTSKPEKAREHLTTATTMYREMGMTYWLEQAETEGLTAK